MTRKRALTLLALALSLLTAPLSAAETEFEARIWAPDLGGSVKVTQGGTGTEIKLPDTLGFSDEDSYEVRLSWRTDGAFVLRFGYLPLSYSGNANLSDLIDFNGVIFPVALEVASDLDVEYGRIGIGLLFGSDDSFRIGPIVEVKAMRIQAELTGRVLGLPLVSARESTEGAFLSVGLGFDARPSQKLSVVGEVGYSPGLEYGEMIDAELGVKYSPVKILSVFGGYRLLDLDLEVDDDTANLELSGPYVGVSLTF